MNYHTLTTELEHNLGLSKLSETEKELIFQKLGDTIIERILLTIATTLTEDEAGETVALFKRGNLKEVINVITEKHPELNDTLILVCNDVARDFQNA